jgi:TonB family protein
MRLTFAASLLLSPALFTAAAVASQPKADVPATTQVIHIGNSVLSPATLNSNNFHISGNSLDQTGTVGAKVVLSMNIDEKGNASNVRVVQSASPELDARVVSAVRQAYFHPARLDNRAVPVAIDLVVVVQR